MIDRQLSRIQNLINIWFEIFIIIEFEVILCSYSVGGGDAVAVAFLAEKDEVITAAFCGDVAIVLHIMDVPSACDASWVLRQLEAWGTHVGLHKPGAFVSSSK